MNEKNTINRIRSLKDIKPQAEWVSSTRANLLGNKPAILFTPFYSQLKTPALIMTTTLILLTGLFIHHTDQQQKAVQETIRVARQNEIETLSMTLTELKDAKAKIDSKVDNLIAQKANQEATTTINTIAPLLIEIEEKEVELKKSILTMEDAGIILASFSGIGDESLNIKRITSHIMNSNENRELTEEETLIFNQAEKQFIEGKYNESLEKALKIADN